MIKYKKGFTITEIAAIIVAIVIIGLVAYITLPSLGISFTGISETIKKFAGLETKKVEASTIKNIEGCTIKRYYWTKTVVKLGEPASIVVEGNGNCDGKDVAINAFNEGWVWDSNYLSLNPQFKDIKTEISFPTKEKGTFYFILKFGDYTSPKSARLNVG